MCDLIKSKDIFYVVVDTLTAEVDGVEVSGLLAEMGLGAVHSTYADTVIPRHCRPLGPPRII